MHWERGDITFLYCGDAKAAGMSLFVMDNELKVLKSYLRCRETFFRVKYWLTTAMATAYAYRNSNQVYQRVRTEETEMEFEDEVDLLMSGDIISAQVSTKPISFNKAKAGWIFREDREEMVGNYRATFYNVNGINLETRKRREHLSDADLQKNKQLLESFTKGNMEQGGQSQDVLSVDTIYAPSLKKLCLDVGHITEYGSFQP